MGTDQARRALSDLASRSPVTDFERRVYCVLGLPFDAVTIGETAAMVRDAARSRRRCFLTTPNLHWVVACRNEEELRTSVLQSDLSVVDGMPLIWVARALGIPLPERVAGSDVFEQLQSAPPPALSVYFFGGSEAAAAGACSTLAASSGGVGCAGYQSPGFGSVDEMSGAARLERINASHADFLLVSLSARKGQAWILRNLSLLDPPVVSYFGAVVNFVAGSLARAPTRWRRMGLEWLWRIRQEPALWRRYARDAIGFAGLLAVNVVPGMLALHLRKPSPASLRAARVVMTADGDRCIVSVAGAWTAGNLAPLRRAFAEATSSGCDIALDLRETVFIDNACAGLLLILRGHQDKIGRRLSIDAPSATMRRQLQRHCIGYLLAK